MLLEVIEQLSKLSSRGSVRRNLEGRRDRHPAPDLDAFLDPAREDEQLLGLVDSRRREGSQAHLGVAERPLLPAGNDHRRERRAATLTAQPSTMPSAAAEGAGSGSRIMRSALTTPSSDASSATRSAI